MATEFFDWGIPLTDQELEQIPEALKAFADVCVKHPIRVYARNEVSDQFMVILDIGDGTFESENLPGILRIERISVTYKPKTDFHWEVRPLRMDFPVTMHQNHVLEGEPRSLCLYMEGWRSVERTWTPESFLQRILWWLRSAADGTIHADDQPLERLLFDSSYTILLPRGHFEKCNDPAYRLALKSIAPADTKQVTFRGQYVPTSEINDQQTTSCIPISVMLTPIENGPVEAYPTSLGGLQDMVTSRDADLLQPLNAAIKERVGSDGLTPEKSSEYRFILILLGVPRTRNGRVEKIESLGFAIKADLGKLGEALALLFKSPTDSKWYIDEPIDSADAIKNDSWRSLPLDLLRIQHFPSDQKIRTYSGLEADDPGPTGIIAGLGALGSNLAQLWAREAWGSWHYVDSDILQAHNIVRHIASHEAIGFTKTQVARCLTDNLYMKADGSTDKDYVGSITDDAPSLSTWMEQADIWSTLQPHCTCLVTWLKWTLPPG